MRVLLSTGLTNVEKELESALRPAVINANAATTAELRYPVPRNTVQEIVVLDPH